MVVSKQDGIYTSYKPCKCSEMNKTNKNWEKSGLKVTDLDKTFVNFETWNLAIRDLKDKATNYYMRFEANKSTRNNSILFSGVPGSGKTHLALALANNFLKKGYNVVYMPYIQASLEIKQNLTNSKEYGNLINKYKECDILLIDDLLKGKYTDYDKNILFEIVNHRYINNLPMIISTEKSVKELLEFDQAIGSRIFEMSQKSVIEVKDNKNNYRTRGVY